MNTSEQSSVNIRAVFFCHHEKNSHCLKLFCTEHFCTSYEEWLCKNENEFAKIGVCDSFPKVMRILAGMCEVCLAVWELGNNIWKDQFPENVTDSRTEHSLGGIMSYTSKKKRTALCPKKNLAICCVRKKFLGLCCYNVILFLEGHAI